MLAEELSIIDADSSLWIAARSLLDAALRLEQHDEAYRWHGWSKQQIDTFLKQLPAHCTLVVGVWETVKGENDDQEREVLTLGAVCEIINGEVYSIRSFEALVGDDLPPVKALEPGFDHAYMLMRAVRACVAPVAWALFTDKATWDEWLFATGDDEHETDKGALLASFAHQGRCVLLGSQAARHYHHL